MTDAFPDFDDNVREVKAYFRFLELVLEPDAKVYRPHRRSYKYRDIDSDALKMVRASAILVLYNLTESTIRTAVSAIYEAIGRDGLTYSQMKDEVRAAWIDYKIKDLSNGPVNVDSVRKAARSIVDAVVDGDHISIEGGWIRGSGNLDARRIRGIAKWLGFSSRFRFDHRAHDSLKIVKDKRNDLAHGLSSFSQCGGEFTASQLIKIQKEVLTYLKGVLRNVKQYIDTREYAVTPRTA